MAVSIVSKFNKQQLKRMLLERKKQIIDRLLLDLNAVGVRFVINARTQAASGEKEWQDQSGNLRSSIGYVIMYNGVQQAENFESQGGKEGEAIARKVAAEIADNFPQGLVLICVAGMEYAAAVESKGFDVITNSATIAVEHLKKAMKKIQQQL